MNKAASEFGQETANIGVSLISTNLYIIIGLFVGALLGLPAYYFQFIEDHKF
jgi:hypothetical protein